MFAICMVYGLQEISACYGGVDGDWGQGSEIDGTTTEFERGPSTSLGTGSLGKSG